MKVEIPCICGRHEKDTITLADTLTFRQTLTIRQEIRFAVELARESGEPLGLAEMTAVMAEAYLLHCIESWTLQDERGKALPLTKTNVRDHLLANYEAAETVGNAADGLYSEKVVLPLILRGSDSSPGTPKNDSTSPTNTSGSTPRKHSKRSSTSTTPMAVTGPMAASPGGASNSWQS